MIPNFHTVEPGIYRGGQPDTEGFRFLQSIGITQVIKLNEDWEGEDILPDGMTLFKVQIPQTEQIITQPDATYLGDAVAFIAPNTFIHCQHGQDRTGIVIGLWRVLKCGWSKKQAYAEMMEHGLHPILFGLAKAWEDLQEPLSEPLTDTGLAGA